MNMQSQCMHRLSSEYPGGVSHEVKLDMDFYLALQQYCDTLGQVQFP